MQSVIFPLEERFQQDACDKGASFENGLTFKMNKYRRQGASEYIVEGIWEARDSSQQTGKKCRPRPCVEVI